MKIYTLFFTLLLSLALITNAAAGYECDHSRDISREIEVSGFAELEVLARAGRLKITGQEGTDVVSINAKMCAENKSDLNEMDVVSKKRGNRILIETVIPRSGGWNDNNYKRIDLVLDIPSNMTLDVADSSGEASVENIKSIVMDDSSGALYIGNISGNVAVTDSSGALRIEDVVGDVEITDSSGSIEVKDVAGELHVHVDSSGEIRAKNIGKNVIIDKDSSGSITVKNVKGDFIVRQDGSGGISYKNIGGEVNIPERKRDR